MQELLPVYFTNLLPRKEMDNLVLEILESLYELDRDEFELLVTADVEVKENSLSSG